MSPSRRRKSFNLRLQPYEGTLLAEVVVYLNSLERDEANRKIAALLIMCLLPLARQKQGEVFSEDFVRGWINMKSREVEESIAMRPHPYEYQLYLDA